MKRTIISLAVLLLAFAASHATIWSEDFTTAPTMRSDYSSTLGGNTSQTAHLEIDFGDWCVANPGTGPGSVHGSVIDGELYVASWALARRGVGVILDPSTFTGGAGTYEVTFDLATTVGDQPLSQVHLDVWAGRDYDLSGDGWARLVLDLGNALADPPINVEGLGGASANLLAQYAAPNATAVLTGQTLQFDYNGTDAVGIIFGSVAKGVGQFDNVSISMIPEPATAGNYVLCDAAVALGDVYSYRLKDNETALGYYTQALSFVQMDKRKARDPAETGSDQ